MIGDCSGAKGVVAFLGRAGREEGLAGSEESRLRRKEGRRKEGKRDRSWFEDSAWVGAHASCPVEATQLLYDGQSEVDSTEASGE